MKVFICNGTPQCFFTAVFDAYRETECIISSASVQIPLGGTVETVFADLEKSRRVQAKINAYDGEAVDDISLVLRSCSPLKEQVAFEYIKEIMRRKTAVKKAFNLPQVVDFNDLLYKITGETHQFKGFIRFMECANGVLYAPYSPDNNITDLLMPHFAARLGELKFVIHDVKRGIAGIHNGKEWILGYAGATEIMLSDDVRGFGTLWKKYYKSVNVSERPHERQMKRSMPVRYWKFLPEKQN